MSSSSDYDFKIYNKILDYSKYLKQYVVVGIPSVHRDLRIHMLDEVYFLARNMYAAIYNKGNIRMKYLVEIQINISMLDMMTDELRSYMCITKKVLDISINKLSEIKKLYMLGN